jgi:hypothetical protein
MSPKNKSPKISKFFFCESCNYKCSKQSEFVKHNLTNKHKILQNPTSINNDKNYACKCGKLYKHSSTLYAHNKKCFQKEKNENNENDEKENANEIILEIENGISSELILNIIQQNQEFKDLLVEQNKQNNELQKQMLQVIKNGTINNNINSNNKTFNLQVFLNETCKDAMNIMDFVDSIKIQLADIESIGELGFVNGISKLIIKNLKALDENMRPVHCSDQKRESLYVKDGNVWEKEDADNKKMRKAIKYIAHKNICALPLWRAKYPDHSNSESKRSDQYNYIMMEAMGGAGDNDEEKAEKIIKKISKEVLINKN